MTTLFISDLHLCPDRPDINRCFFRFLEDEARNADALYILGDLFEYWIGDDDLADPFNASVAAALAKLSDCEVSIGVMHGNRDFLLGADFARASRTSLLAEPCVRDIHGVPTLLMHGDTLCTLDLEYQAFRAKVRTAEWTRNFLQRPLAERRATVQALRRQSETEKQTKSGAIMDVAGAEVESVLRQHDYPRLIHGHTHRPALHLHTVDARRCERWVLSDWYLAGSYLACDASGCQAIRLNA